MTASESTPSPLLLLMRVNALTLWRRLKEFGIETDGSRRPASAATAPSLSR